MKAHIFRSLWVIFPCLLAWYNMGSYGNNENQFSLPAEEYNALEVFYNSTGGPYWTYNGYDQDDIYMYYTYFGYYYGHAVDGIPWVFTNPPQNPCNNSYPWNGIVCSSNCEYSPCNVIELHRVSANLVGTIPVEIGLFSKLKHLEISQNIGLNGKLPYQFSAK